MGKHGDAFRNFDYQWGYLLGKKECPYVKRWTVVFFGYSLRLHHWLSSDNQNVTHDHPFWFLTVMLWGSYVDRSFSGYDRLTVGSIRYRPASHRHTVQVPAGGCWTLLLTGPKLRDWGFYLPGSSEMIQPFAYFKKYGHHPCMDKEP